MKNFIFKSRSDFDLQKFFQLVLTEQRAQRVDLARISKKLDLMITDISIPTHPDEEEEQPDDISGSAEQ